MINNLSDFVVCDNEDNSDIIVINSCTVTNGADSSVRGYISKMETLGKKIYLTGCGAFSKGEELFNTNRVFGVFGHSNKNRINSLLKQDRFFELGDLEYINRDIVSEFVGKSRAFIKIQEGCNFECSYCIIPSVRGRARSIDMNIVLNQIEILANNGFGEFILTGTNVGSYGIDIDTNISRLIKEISKLRHGVLISIY
jgi:tRNA A37 methylthiotransferase MiaB